MAAAMDNLDAEARKLYQQAVAEARRDTGAQGGGDDHGGRASGGTRERPLYDPRNYKIADLQAESSLAAFEKWRHDLDLFLVTIGTSWKV